MVQLICGILRFDGSAASADQLAAMLDMMSPPGRAVARATLVRGKLALGVLEVSPNRDLPASAPVIAEDGGRILAADLRLYARGPDALEPPDSSAGSLLERLRRSGYDAVADLHGDFAFASFDEATGSLVLGRDHFGVRPLHYTTNQDFAAFASSPRALLRTGLAPRDLNEEVIDTFLSRECAPPHRSYFKHVARVPQAHYVRFRPGFPPETKRYWRIAIEDPLPAGIDPAVAERELARLLTQAVARRLPAAGDVGGHLSGGLDSSAIAAIAARLVRDAGRTFHGYSYQELEKDIELPPVHEGVYADETARAEPNIELHRFATDGTVRNILEAVDSETMLIVAPGDAEQKVLQDLSRRGIGTMLSGWGGDQIITNYGTAAESELFIRGEYGLLRRQLRALSKKTGASVPRLMWERVLKRCLPEAVRALRRREPPEPLQFIAPGRSPALDERKRVFASSLQHRRHKMERWWQPHRLEMMAQLGAPYGVAYTFPMLDLDLVRYGMRLPGLLFNRDGVSRAVFRDAMKGILPERVRLRMDKRSPYFLNPYRDARMKQAAARAVQELRQHPLVSRYLDVAKIEAYIEAGPEPEEVLAALRSTDVTQLTQEYFHADHLPALVLAMFLKAQTEIGDPGADSKLRASETA